jgi:hypothetical protein
MTNSLMIPNIDIYRAAKLMIDQHGEEAPIRVAERADELLESGDIDGAGIWRRLWGRLRSCSSGLSPDKWSIEDLATLPWAGVPKQKASVLTRRDTRQRGLRTALLWGYRRAQNASLKEDARSALLLAL